jgi:hypothetical protein
MITTKNTFFNVKYYVEESRIFSNFPLLLYINRSPTLPSLCKALHNDGWGEGFEQHDIHTSEGDIYVSFYDSSGSWELMTEEEIKGTPDAPTEDVGLRM